jgi:E-phenylitaconyl-CoA hydratase
VDSPHASGATRATPPVDGVRFERRGPIALVTIDNPKSRNALTLAAHTELVRRWNAIQSDIDIRAMVLTGAEDPSIPAEKQSFCAGSDMRELAAGVFSEEGEGVPSLASVENRTPVIAAVNGYCIGAGLTFLLASELRVASPTATFGLPEVQLGTVPGNGGVRQATLELPRAVVMELLLLPGRMAAARALELGLVNSIVPHEEVLATALEWADAIAGLPVDAVRSAMMLAETARHVSRNDAANLETQTMRDLHHSAVPPVGVNPHQ